MDSMCLLENELIGSIEKYFEMKKMYFAAALMVSALMMVACNSNAPAEEVEDSVATEEVVDALSYIGYPHGEEMPVEFLVVEDTLWKAYANDEEMPVLDKHQAMVVYGEEEPTAVADSLGKEYKMVKCVKTSVRDRMNHGEKNNAWIILYGNEECHGCCNQK